MSKCLEEEDEFLCGDSNYVPNSSTFRVKVYLPNSHPLLIVLKKDATVQDAIEKTIRISNALTSLFQKKCKELKEEAEKAAAEKNETEQEVLATSPPLDMSEFDSTKGDGPQHHDSLDGLTDFLESSNMETSRRRSLLNEEIVASKRFDNIIGSKAMTLLTDGMAYELRMEIADGECDMDFPGEAIE